MNKKKIVIISVVIVMIILVALFLLLKTNENKEKEDIQEETIEETLSEEEEEFEKELNKQLNIFFHGLVLETYNTKTKEEIKQMFYNQIEIDKHPPEFKTEIDSQFDEYFSENLEKAKLQDEDYFMEMMNNFLLEIDIFFQKLTYEDYRDNSKEQLLSDFENYLYEKDIKLDEQTIEQEFDLFYDMYYEMNYLNMEELENI